MIIIRQKRIYREDLGTNDKVALYLFGDNLMHEGMGGQAAEMRGEPNAVGIPTKKAPYNHPEAFFSDEGFDYMVGVYGKIFDTIKDDYRRGKFKVLVIPADGLGTGLAELNTRAPKIFALLQEHLRELEEQE